eukprot:221200_1
MGSKWSSLSPDTNIKSDCFQLTVIDNELIICSYNFDPNCFASRWQRCVFNNDAKMVYDNGGIRLHRYDSKTNKWKYFLEYPCWSKSFSPLVAMDKKSYILWILSENHKLIKCDLSSSNIIQIFNERNKISLRNGFNLPFIVDGTFHIINERRHYIFNENDSRFHTISLPGNTNNFLASGLAFSSVIYVPSKQCIFVMGGLEEKEISFQQVKAGKRDLPIYSYSLKTKKWSKLRITLPIRMYGFACVLNESETHMLLFGGQVGYKAPINDIYIFNLLTMKFSKSKRKCPMSGDFFVAMVKEYTKDSNVLVNGFIEYKIKKNKSVAPQCVINIIESYLDGIEYVHLMNKTGYMCKKQKHWKIPLYTLMI